MNIYEYCGLLKVLINYILKKSIVITNSFGDKNFFHSKKKSL